MQRSDGFAARLGSSLDQPQIENRGLAGLSQMKDWGMPLSIFQERRNGGSGVY